MNSSILPSWWGLAREHHRQASRNIQIANSIGVYILIYVEVSNYVDIPDLKPGPHP